MVMIVKKLSGVGDSFGGGDGNNWGLVVWVSSGNVLFFWRASVVVLVFGFVQ